MWEHIASQCLLKGDNQIDLFYHRILGFTRESCIYACYFPIKEVQWVAEAIDLLAIFEQVFILYIFGITGYVLCKAKLVDPSHSKTLSVLLIYVFLPCVSFNTFSAQFNMDYLRNNAALLLVSMGLLPISVGVAKLINRFLTKDPYEKAVNEFSMSMSNASYMGFPLAEGIFGSAGLLNCMMFVMPILIYIGTVSYNSLTAGKKKKSLLKKIFTPSMIGILLGCVVGLFDIQLPEVVGAVTGKAGACMAPISMLLTGMTISQFPIKELLANKRTYLIATVRLVLAPLMIFVILKLCHLNFALTPAVMIYAMPCGMNSIIFPQLVGKDCRLGASTVLISTALSMLTIPLMLTLLL